MVELGAETRTKTEYLAFTLCTLVQEKDSERVDRVPVAIFTDRAAMKRYVEESDKPERFVDYEGQEEWYDTEPLADNFALPFNPEPLVAPVVAETAPESVEEAETEDEANGAD